MSWLDRPIRAGDPFVPVTSCRVSSRANAWLFEPHGTGGGRWARIPSPAGWDAPPEVPEGAWKPYEWIVWWEDGSDYRLGWGARAS